MNVLITGTTMGIGRAIALIDNGELLKSNFIW